MKSPSAALLDAGAVALSSLCLLHCLALPLLAAALPLFGTWAEAEWVHLLFVAIALPLTGYALWRAERRRPLPVLAWATAGVGLGLLLAGALALPTHDWETPMTVAGSLLLAATHIWNARHRHAGESRLLVDSRAKRGVFRWLYEEQSTNSRLYRPSAYLP